MFIYNDGDTTFSSHLHLSLFWLIPCQILISLPYYTILIIMNYGV